MQKVRRDGKVAMEATPEAVESWVRHVENLYARTVMDKGDPSIHNWMVGNNVPGKARTIMFYFGGAGMYFQELNENVEMGFPGFEFSDAKSAATATT
jgi:cyclohexanone monooxygenase